jgi:hypothetical protein
VTLRVRSLRWRAAVGLTALALTVVGCGQGAPESSAPESSAPESSAPAPSAPAPSAPSPTAHEASGDTTDEEAATPSRGPKDGDEPIVLAISVDALSPAALQELGPAGAPTLHRLLREGAATLNARTAFESTDTLPNHAGMLTGRPVLPDNAGHGVTWNVDLDGDTVPGPGSGSTIDSVFTVAHSAGLRTGLFAGKTKFNVFPDTWPDLINRVVIHSDGDQPMQLARRVERFLVKKQPAFTFWHNGAPDAAGHRAGGMSPAYLDAVKSTDQAIGTVVAAIEADDELARRTLVVLTADHGVTKGDNVHGARTVDNATIPFIIWGAGVEAGDLYELNSGPSNDGPSNDGPSNDGWRDPGAGVPDYEGPQPIRNLHLADVAVAALGLPAEPLPSPSVPLNW